MPHPMATTPLTSRPPGGQQSANHWREAKRQRTMSLTDGAWGIADEIAASTGLNRSEQAEILWRYAKEQGLDLLTLRAKQVAALD
jgi:hypothetical protein